MRRWHSCRSFMRNVSILLVAPLNSRTSPLCVHSFLFIACMCSTSKARRFSYFFKKSHVSCQCGVRTAISHEECRHIIPQRRRGRRRRRRGGGGRQRHLCETIDSLYEPQVLCEGNFSRYTKKNNLQARAVLRYLQRPKETVCVFIHTKRNDCDFILQPFSESRRCPTTARLFHSKSQFPDSNDSYRHIFRSAQHTISTC